MTATDKHRIEFIKALAEIRLSKGITQEEAGKLMRPKRRQAWVSNFENGNVKVFNSYIEYAIALGVKIEILS